MRTQNSYDTIQFIDYIVMAALGDGDKTVPEIVVAVQALVDETANLTYRVSRKVTTESIRSSVYRMQKVGIADRPNGLYGRVSLVDTTFAQEIQNRFGGDFLDWPVKVPFIGSKPNWKSAEFAN